MFWEQMGTNPQRCINMQSLRTGIRLHMEHAMCLFRTDLRSADHHDLDDKIRSPLIA